MNYIVNPLRDKDKNPIEKKDRLWHLVIGEERNLILCTNQNFEEGEIGQDYTVKTVQNGVTCEKCLELMKDRVQTEQQIIDIISSVDSKWEGDNAYKGCQIIAKYTDNVIQGAGHEEIWSLDLMDMVKLGFTVEDVTALALLNWITNESDDYLVCYV